VRKFPTFSFPFLLFLNFKNEMANIPGRAPYYSTWSNLLAIQSFGASSIFSFPDFPSQLDILHRDLSDGNLSSRCFQLGPLCLDQLYLNATITPTSLELLRFACRLSVCVDNSVIFGFLLRVSYDAILMQLRTLCYVYYALLHCLMLLGHETSTCCVCSPHVVFLQVAVFERW